MLLLGGILPLAVGPLLASWAERSKATKSALDAFIAVSLAGIVLLHLWPHSFLVAGGWALAGGLVGLLLPFVLHGSLHSQEDRIYPAMVAIAFFGLALHAVLDGVALLSPLMSEQAHAHPDHHHDAAHHGQGSAYLLAIAVILHRLPMGIAVWWLTVPVLGRRVAIGVLTTIAGATVLGFAVAGRILVDLSIPAIAIFEATIAGMLLHVVMGHEHKHESLEEAHGHTHHPAATHTHGHTHGHSHTHAHSLGTAEREASPWASALGALAGLALVAGLFQVHPMEHQLAQDLSFDQAFRTLLLQLAPWLLLGVGLEMLRGALRRRRRPSEASVRSELTLPAAAVAFGLLGWQWTLLYLSGYAWIRICLRESSRTAASPEANASGWMARFERLAHRNGVWALAGIAAVALMEPILRIDPGAGLAGPAWVGSALGGAVAIVLGALCSRSSLFAVVLAFFFAHMGWPGTDVFLFLFAALAARRFGGSRARDERLRGWRVALLLAGLGLLATAPRLGLTASAADFHTLAALAPTPLQLAALTVLAVSLTASLFLRGFRGFLYPVFDRAPELHGSWHSEEDTTLHTRGEISHTEAL